MKAWQDEFPGTTPSVSLKNKLNSKSKTFESVIGVYVFNCVFNDIKKDEGNGGAINAESSVDNFYAESSLFINVSSKRNGGAIYLAVDYSFQKYLCYYLCSCQQHGQSCYVSIKDTLEGKNHAYGCSVTKCSGISIFQLEYGSISVESNNFSSNNDDGNILFNMGATTTNKLSFTSITENKVKIVNFISLQCGDNYECSIDNCNFIDNSAGNYLFSLRGNSKLFNSCLIQNAYSGFFVNDHYKVFTVTNCTIDKEITGDDLVFNKNTGTSFSIPPHLICAQNCNGSTDFPLEIATITRKMKRRFIKFHLCFVSILFFDVFH